MAGFMELVFWQEASVCDDDGNYIPRSFAPEEIQRGGVIAHGSLWWAQYTAPGYMDQTDPVYGDTAVEALEECFAMYGDDTDPEERAEYAACLWEARKLRRKGA